MPDFNMQKKYFLYFILFFFVFNAKALSENLHFDENLMSANGISVGQLTDALNRHVIPQGYTKAEIYINGSYVASGEINYQGGMLFFSREIKLKSGVKENGWLIHRGNNHGVFYTLKKTINFKYDRADTSIRISVPAEFLKEPGGQRRLGGGNGVFVNYNTYGYRYSGNSGTLDSLSADYEVGVNINNAIIRTHGNYSQFRSRNASIAVNQVRDVYFDRDFNQVRIRAGRTMVNDGGFGTGYIDGVIVSSAEGNASAYINFTYDAPEVLNVEIWQNNLLIWKQIIQKGHAELRNIPVAGFSGDVTVLVKRHDQIIDSRIIARGQITAKRDGMTGYYAFSGRAMNGSRNIVNGVKFSKTLGKLLAPSVAVVSAGKYRGVTVSNSTFQGEFRTTAWLTGIQNEKGQRSLSMNVTANYKNTSLSYSSNSRNFSYIGQALQDNYNSERSSLSLSQTQQFSYGLTGSISLTHYRFYTAPSNDAISASLNMRLGKASLGMGVAYMAPGPGRSVRDKASVNLSLSIPLDLGDHNANWRSQYYSYGESARLSNSLSSQVTDRYTVTASHQRVYGISRSESYTLDNNVSTPYTTAGLSLSQGKDEGGTSQITTASLSGAVAISRAGVIFSPGRIGDTWAVVDTGIHRYLKVASLQNSVVTNHDGKAVISPVAEGRADFIRVSPEGLPSGIVVKNNFREFSADRGAVSFFEFNVVNNRSLLMRWKSKPAWIQQSDIFYDEGGKVIARFIDKDILLINEKDINKLQKLGMSSPSRVNVQCRLNNFNLKAQESINDVIFKCNGA